jgi:hypothetical protein
MQGRTTSVASLDAAYVRIGRSVRRAFLEQPVAPVQFGRDLAIKIHLQMPLFTTYALQGLRVFANLARLAGHPDRDRVEPDFRREAAFSHNVGGGDLIVAALTRTCPGSARRFSRSRECARLGKSRGQRFYSRDPSGWHGLVKDHSNVNLRAATLELSIG